MSQGFRLSPQQRRLWGWHRVCGDAPFRARLLSRLEGDLDRKALAAAASAAAARHEILRTGFPCPPGLTVPLQSARDVGPDWGEVDLSGLSTAEREAALEEIFRAAGLLAQGLAEPPLTQLRLARLGEREHALVIGLPALCADEVALGLLLREIAAKYAGEAADEPLQYADLAEWQNEILEGEGMESGREFWREQVASRVSLRLPFAHPGREASFDPGALPLALDQAAADGLEILARTLGEPDWAVLLTLWQETLRRFAGQPEVTVGIAAAGRSYEGLESALGLFSRTLPLARRADGEDSLWQAATRNREAVEEMLGWQELFDWNALLGDQGRQGPPRFAAAFRVAEWPEPWEQAGVRFAVQRLEARVEPFQVQLTLLRSGDGLSAVLEHDRAAVREEDAAGLAAALLAMLRDAARRPESALARLDALDESRRRGLLAGALGPVAPFPGSGLVLSRIEEQARRHPRRTAVVDEERQITYGELDARAEALARRLRRRGAGPESVVALLLERCLEMVVAVLGVWKAGAAYLPVDPSLPVERRDFLLRDAGARIVLTAEEVALLDGGSADEAPAPTAVPAAPGNLAYVLYTSGSTGIPKGVAVEHRQLWNYVHAVESVLGLPEGASYAMVSSFAADLGNTVLFPALCGGGTLHVVSPQRSVDPAGLAEYFARHGVDCTKIVPSHLEALLASTAGPGALPRRRLVLGGEASRWDWLDQLQARAPECRILNHYGPTEATVGVTTYPCEAGGDRRAVGPPLGLPLTNTVLHVLDGGQEPAPYWVPGELWIGGAGIARGYLGRPDLTAERFLPDPFAAAPGTRLYRTGDLVRRRPDGCVEFLGRIDDQVKIRGFRVELGEIAAVLERHPAVRRAEVLACPDAVGQKRVVAYVAAAAPAPATAELRRFLQERLPEVMIPAAFAVLDALPLTANGKVDRRALPDPDWKKPELEAAYVPPAGEVETTLAAIWSSVLGVERVGAADNFFHLGGDSIRSIVVRSRAAERGLNVEIQQLFELPTLRDLARELSPTGAHPEPLPSAPFSLLPEEDRSLVSAGIEDAYPLAWLQRGMVFHSQLDAGTAVYHDLHSVHLRCAFDPGAMAAAVAEVMARHAALRTSFDLATFSEPAQLVHRHVDPPLEVRDLRALPADAVGPEVLAQLQAERLHAIDGAVAPLVRFLVHRRSEDCFQFTLSFHHAVLDGWSAAALLTELFQRYLKRLRGVWEPAAPPPVASYRDFVRLEREALASEDTRAFWREQITGAGRLPRLPPEPAEAAEPVRVEAEAVAIPESLSDRLNSLAKKAGVPIKSVLLAAHLRVLARLSGEDEALTGLVTHGRPELEGGEQVLGLFLNTLPFRLRPQGDSWEGLAQRAFRLEREFLPHRRYPLGELLRERGGEPPFDALFNFMHYHVYDSVSGLGGVEVLGLYDYEETNFPLVAHFSLSPVTGHLRLRLNFRAPETGRAQRRAVAGFYLAALNAMANVPDAPCEADDLLTAEERRQIVHGWNSTVRVYAGPQTLHGLVEGQADRTPEAVAVTFEGESLTWRELDGRANRLARYLRHLGTAPEEAVAVYLERSMDLVVSLLAVLKAGGAYVPLDPSYPRERLTYMLESSRAGVVLTLDRLAASLPGTGARVVRLDLGSGEIARERGERLDVPVTPEGLAYVIYTSGSTGRPKGAMNSHQAIVNRLLWMQEAFGLTPDDRVLQKTPFSFDVSVWELFWPLATGARLVVAAPEKHRDSGYLHQIIAAESITTLHFVPSMLRAFLEDEERPAGTSSLRRVICSGEALPFDLQECFFERFQAELHNLYGPTEAAVDVSWWACRWGDPRCLVPIGHAIANLRLYVVDPVGSPSPVGAPGELLIGGVGLGRGYFERPDLTAERFVPDPFSGDPGGRLYRTGDLARFLPDGAIDFLGRIDNQVKVRGFRIELGEIEAALQGHPLVRQSAVLARQDRPTEAHLVAYIVAGGTTPAVHELQNHLRETLPEYMVPATYVFLDALPLTPSGKLDRRALPTPAAGRPESSTAFAPPRTPAEQALAEVWREVLGVDRVGVHDNFFALGGDSIRSIQVRSRARRRGFDFPLQQLFQNPTLERLAREVSAAGQEPAHLEPFALLADDERARAPEGVEDGYPLARLQAGMLFHAGYQEGSTTYHDVLTFHLRAPFQPEALEATLDALMARHPVLRSSFDLTSSPAPVQWVHATAKVRLEIGDLSHFSADAQEAELSAQIDRERRRPFVLHKPPLLRVAVHRRGPDSFQFTWSFHHAILDGWSVHTLLVELFRDYLSRFGRSTAPEPSPAARFAEYVALEREALASDDTRRFWAETLQERTFTPLPLWLRRHTGMRTRDRRVRRYPVHLPAGLSAGLRHAAAAADVPLKSVLLAAHLKVLSLLSGRDDVITGLVSNGRPEREDGDRVAGLFLNTLPFRFRLREESWSGLAREVFVAERKLLPHRRFPLAEMQRMSGDQPLFETMFNYVHFHVYRALTALEDVEVLSADFNEETNLTLVASFQVDPSTTEIGLELSCDELGVDTVQAQSIATLYARVLASLAAEPGACHAAGQALPEPQRHQGVLEWNDTRADYPGLHRLHRLFEDQVDRTPDTVAVICEGESLTYAELDRRANRLARYLRSLGVGPEVPAAVLLERSLDLVVALLGVLKAGGAYVPFDAGYPGERLAYMLEDSAAPVLLTHRRLDERLPPGRAAVVHLDADAGLIARQEAGRPDSGVLEDSPAYIIYTSGSTGRPKGAVNTHRAICNRLLWMQDAFGLTAEDRVLQKTPFSFDVSVWEFFWPLLTGARLVVARPEGHRDPAYLRELIEREGVTTLHFVPSMLRAFLEQDGLRPPCRSLLRVICSGEALPFELQERFFGFVDAELHNLYGPTEAAVDVSGWRCRRGGDLGIVPIGRPIANLRLHVLDAGLQPAPLGTPGELYLAGVGLARGYWRRSDLTADRFVPDPLASAPGERLYRTGDECRFLPDGALEYLGRLDQQVKIRGFRIELGEIEGVLARHPVVKDVAVGVRQDGPGGPRIVAYIVPREGREPDAGELRGALESSLPDYMVPTAFVFLASLPLTPSGKLDRRALPAPERGQTGQGREHAAPRTPEETLLAGIWAEILGLERVGIHDSFFELGGDSILSLQVVARARQAGLALVPEQIFEHRTLAGVAAVVQRAGPAPAQEEEPVAGPVSLTPVQAWFFEREFRDPHHWNQSVFLEARTPLDPRRLEAVFRLQVDRHEALRWRFAREADGWRANVTAAAEAPFAALDLAALPEAQLATALERAGADLQASLELTRGPLARLILFDCGEGRAQRLLLVIHHLAVDGVSWQILLEDLQLAYEQLGRGGEVRLPAKTSSLRRWTRGLAELAGSGALEAEAACWTAPERAAVPSLPVDFGDRRSNSVASTGMVSVALSPEETRALLHEVPSAYQTRINDVLLTALARVFRRWSGSPALFLDLEGHGREPLIEGIDLSRTVGWLTALVPVVLRLDGRDHSGEDLKAVKEQLRALPAHGLSHGVLRYLGQGETPRRLRAMPRPEVCFNYLGRLDRALPASSLFAPAREPSGPSRSPRGERPWLLEIVGALTGERLRLSWTYSENLYRRSTIEALAEGYIQDLRALIEHCTVPEAGSFTPSDFPLSGLGQQSLDDFIAAIQASDGSATA